MKPAFRIVVDGADRSAVIGDRLISLLVTDEDGRKADRVEIELDNRDSRIAFPEIEARLEVSLGFAGRQLAPMGIYAVDGVSGRGPVRTLSITATAADLKGEIRAPRTRSWIDRSLPLIVSAIAGEAGLKPLVGESLRGIRWPFLAQTAESNLHFLTRIAAELDATCKPAGGALIVQRRGEGQTAAGDRLEPVTIRPLRLSDWSWSLEGPHRLPVGRGGMDRDRHRRHAQGQGRLGHAAEEDPPSLCHRGRGHPRRRIRAARCRPRGDGDHLHAFGLRAPAAGRRHCHPGGAGARAERRMAPEIGQPPARRRRAGDRVPGRKGPGMTPADI
ncbi:hypothetical protein [Paracoccus aminovorans]|uniref:hypothetical protein n=1 Tax=Paracoccus aminovorans TaxID=34004 RepID=UPI000A51A42D|nr:hypothetical protein [Paracoccus aminovorans]